MLTFYYVKISWATFADRIN